MGKKFEMRFASAKLRKLVRERVRDFYRLRESDRNGDTVDVAILALEHGTSFSVSEMLTLREVAADYAEK